MRSRVKLRPWGHADVHGRPDDGRGRPKGKFYRRSSVLTSLALHDLKCSNLHR
jgi:hypothetical protein